MVGGDFGDQAWSGWLLRVGRGPPRWWWVCGGELWACRPVLGVV